MNLSTKRIPPPPIPSFVFEIDSASSTCLLADARGMIDADSLANRAATASMQSTENHISGLTRHLMGAPRSTR